MSPVCSLIDAPGASGASDTLTVPGTVRLREVNPCTGRTYAASWSRSLPVHVADAVRDVFGITPARWDRLVGSARLPEVVDVDRPLPLERFLQAVHAGSTRSSGQATDSPCEDCGGWGAVVEYATVVLCGCTPVAPPARRAHPDPRLTLTCHERGWL